MTHRLAFLYPGHAAENDYPTMEALLGGDITLDVVHTTMNEDAHRVDALLDVGGHERLAAGAEQFRSRDVDAIVWACTSGSFVFGWDGASSQVGKLGAVLGIPASSTSFAFVHAARVVGARRLAVAATYPEDVAVRFAEFLGEGGFEVVHLSSRGIVTAAEVGTLGRGDVLDFAAANDHPRADALLMPDTALHTVSCLEDLEARAGKPVLTANQASVWEGMRLAGASTSRSGLGSLFRYS